MKDFEGFQKEEDIAKLDDFAQKEQMRHEIDVLRLHTWKDWVYTAKLGEIVKVYT